MTCVGKRGAPYGCACCIRPAGLPTRRRHTPRVRFKSHLDPPRPLPGRPVHGSHLPGAPPPRPPRAPPNPSTRPSYPRPTQKPYPPRPPPPNALHCSVYPLLVLCFPPSPTSSTPFLRTNTPSRRCVNQRVRQAPSALPPPHSRYCFLLPPPLPRALRAHTPSPFPPYAHSVASPFLRRPCRRARLLPRFPVLRCCCSCSSAPESSCGSGSCSSSSSPSALRPRPIRSSCGRGRAPTHRAHDPRAVALSEQSVRALCDLGSAQHTGKRQLSKCLVQGYPCIWRAGICAALSMQR